MSRGGLLEAEKAVKLLHSSIFQPPIITIMNGMKRQDTTSKQAMSPAQPGDGLFLPDLCSIRMLLVVIVIAQLLAFVIMLAGSVPGQRWQDLGLISLFVQWLALCSVLVLCLLRPWLERFSNARAGMICFAILMLLTLLISELAFRYVAIPGMDRSTSAHVDFLIRNLAISAIISYVTLRYFYLQYQSRRLLRAESLSRIDALQARIRPHFLFNSMNIIASLTRTKPELAEQAIEDLSRVFRASLVKAQNLIPLVEEITICKSYLHIESLRLGDRLNVDWQIDEQLGQCTVPALLIQPLVENAVIHGIEPLPGGGTIRVSVARTEANTLQLEVINPCSFAADEESACSGHHIAQDNIRDRLNAIYAGEASFNIRAEGELYSVRIELPIQSENALTRDGE